MTADTFNTDKAITALLYVLKELGRTNYHKAFKTLYFAERKHLVEYGGSMLGDDFIKMKYGPVPSRTYDIVKIVDGRYSGFPLSEGFIEAVKARIQTTKPYYMQALAQPDMDYLAETEVECLDEAITLCRPVPFGDLTDLSHDSAWNDAQMHGAMPTIEIAKAGGADEDTIRYIEEGIENSEYYTI